MWHQAICQSRNTSNKYRNQRLEYHVFCSQYSEFSEFHYEKFEEAADFKFWENEIAKPTATVLSFILDALHQYQIGIKKFERSICM